MKVVQTYCNFKLSERQNMAALILRNFADVQNKPYAEIKRVNNYRGEQEFNQKIKKQIKRQWWPSGLERYFSNSSRESLEDHGLNPTRGKNLYGRNLHQLCFIL